MKTGTKLLLGLLLIAGVNYAMSGDKAIKIGNGSNEDDQDDDLQNQPGDTIPSTPIKDIDQPTQEIPVKIDPSIPELPVVKSTIKTPPVSDVNIPLNGRLLLKKGMNNNEVRELQRLMGVMIDGFFTANTEDTLFSIKGVREITLNDYVIAPVVTVSLVKGMVVKAIRPTVLYINSKVASMVYTNSGTILGQVATGNIVGTIQYVPDSQYFVVNSTNNNTLAWVLQADVIKV